MKLLYITNGINGSGGLERVLSVKANYLSKKLGYKVHILTLNNGSKNPFYDFSSSITFHDIVTKGNPLLYFLNYKKGISEIINVVQPNVISVCDDGLKGMLFPILFGKKIPVIYERHVSKQIEFKKEKLSLIEKIKSKFIFNLMELGGSYFNKFVVLTNGNLKEWELNNLLVIPNPLPFSSSEKANLLNKKILVVGKQSYQKSYDRLLEIWKLVNNKYPDWRLEVYGKIDLSFKLDKKANELGLSSSVKFLSPVKNIEEKYIESAIYLMTSRFEGFGMVLIEAMAFGVPCISFNCPHGPADIIKSEEDGFLIPNGDITGFSNSIIKLIENKELRIMMGIQAKINVDRYSPHRIVPMWDKLFRDLVKKGWK